MDNKIYKEGTNITLSEKDSSSGTAREKDFKEILKAQIREGAEEIINSETFKDNIKKELEEEINRETKELENKIENSKIKVIETLGIFVALFTFISVEFQIIKQGNTLLGVSGLTLLLLGSLLFFVIVMDMMLAINNFRKKTNWINKIQNAIKPDSNLKMTILFSIILVTGGVICIFFDSYSSNITIDKNNYDKINSNYSELKNNYSKLNTEYSTANQIINDKINTADIRINNIFNEIELLKTKNYLK
ncbi:MAG: hypothetical protein PHR47_02540 [Candidatus Pacebacteria bacterium]|nr:hypothetical protein [Candidatus Paceibacterota bacterium]